MRDSLQRRTQVRGESGGILVEVLLVTLISAILIGPLVMWFTMSLRAQPVAGEILVRTSADALVGTYFPRDVRAAGAAATADGNDDVPFEDCLGGPGAGGRTLLVLMNRVLIPSDDDDDDDGDGDLGPVDLAFESNQVKTVYTEAPGAADGETSVWRRHCGVTAADGGLLSAAEVVPDVDPGSSAAECLDSVSTCRQLRLVTNLSADVAAGVLGIDEHSVELNAARRVDSASLRFDRTGNRLPRARTELVSVESSPPDYTHEFRAVYDDPNGFVYRFEWAFSTEPHDPMDVDPPSFDVRIEDFTPASGQGPPTGSPSNQTVDWQQEGTYFVQLKVTDNDGGTFTTFRRVQLTLPSPVARARVTPENNGVAASTEFVLEANWDGGEGTENPAQLPLTYEWVMELVGDDDDDSGPPPVPPPNTRFGVTTDSPVPIVTAVPPNMVGSVRFTLTVTDIDGRSSSFTNRVDVEPPPGPDPAGPVPGTPLQLPAIVNSGDRISFVPGTPELRYRIEHDLGCGGPVFEIFVPAGHPPGEPFASSLLPTTCPPPFTAQVRVVVDDGVGTAASGWFPVSSAMRLGGA